MRRSVRSDHAFEHEAFRDREIQFRTCVRFIQFRPPVDIGQHHFPRSGDTGGERIDELHLRLRIVPVRKSHRDAGSLEGLLEYAHDVDMRDEGGPTLLRYRNIPDGPLSSRLLKAAEGRPVPPSPRRRLRIHGVPLSKHRTAEGNREGIGPSLPPFSPIPTRNAGTPSRLPWRPNPMAVIPPYRAQRTSTNPRGRASQRSPASIPPGSGVHPTHPDDIPRGMPALSAGGSIRHHG